MILVVIALLIGTVVTLYYLFLGVLIIIGWIINLLVPDIEEGDWHDVTQE